MKSKIFDLQFIIGLFFSLIGLIIFLGSFVYKEDSSYPYPINFYSGLGLMLFGAIMLLSFFRKIKKEVS